MIQISHRSTIIDYRIECNDSKTSKTERVRYRDSFEEHNEIYNSTGLPGYGLTDDDNQHQTILITRLAQT